MGIIRNETGIITTLLSTELNNLAYLSTVTSPAYDNSISAYEFGLFELTSTTAGTTAATAPFAFDFSFLVSLNGIDYSEESVNYFCLQISSLTTEQIHYAMRIELPISHFKIRCKQRAGFGYSTGASGNILKMLPYSSFHVDQ